MQSMQEYKDFISKVRESIGVEEFTPDENGLISVRVETRGQKGVNAALAGWVPRQAPLPGCPVLSDQGILLAGELPVSDSL